MFLSDMDAQRQDTFAVGVRLDLVRFSGLKDGRATKRLQRIRVIILRASVRVPRRRTVACVVQVIQ